MDNREIELKLLTDAAGMRRLKRLDWLKTLQRGKPVNRVLHSVYFDTPDMMLSEAGAALRVRSIGRRRVQALKTVGDGLGGAMDRDEWETDIGSDTPDAESLRATALAPLFTDDVLAALAPRITTHIKRRAVIVDVDGATIEVAFDEGEIAADAATDPICEVELELIDGSRAALYALALRLHAAVPLRVGHVNKAARGFRLLSGARPRPSKWSGSAVAHGMTAAEAFQSIARGCLAHLAANEECLLATSAPEAVHQIRVALRRLRSAMALFAALIAGPEADALKDELRWLLQQLGPARDTDVFLAEIIAPVVATFPDEPALAQLQADFLAERAAHYDTALAALHQPRFTNLLLSLGRWLEGGDWRASDDPAALVHQPIEDIAANLLERRDKKLRKAAKKLAKLSPAERHAARIIGKKLRYAAEFFAPLYPDKRARRTLAALAELQERLGVLNDIAVAAHNLDSRLSGPAEAGARHGWAAGLVVGWHSAQAPRLLKQAQAAYDAWADLPRMWR